MRSSVLALLVAVAVALGCGGSSKHGSGDGGPGPQPDGAVTPGADAALDAPRTDAPATHQDGAAAGDAAVAFPASSRVLYIHHSTGLVIWGGGVPDCVAAYNGAQGTSYAITERSYPDTPYPWANYPYDYWTLWVEHAGARAWDEQDTLEILTQSYEVISFKHCFPVSAVEADTGSPDITSSTQTQENYKLQYAALKDKLHEFPNVRFIVWTGAALREVDTDPDSAQRAHDFFEWVKSTWDEPGDNIFIWDFRQLETEGGLYLSPANASTDSHPNDTFAQAAAPLFCQRLADVISGRGDSTSLTGQ